MMSSGPGEIAKSWAFRLAGGILLGALFLNVLLGPPASGQDAVQVVLSAPTPVAP